MIKTIQKCRICGNEHLAPVIDLGKMHIQGAFEKEGVASPPKRKVPNEVVRCDTSKMENACGAAQARHSIDPEILYRNYWYESGVSKTMRDHLKNIAEECDRLLKTEEESPHTRGAALDIACNDGTLLKYYGDRYLKWGVDPSDIAARSAKEAGIILINECFPTKKLLGKFDIITTIACFYDIDDPIGFANQVSQHLKEKGIWCFEVAYWPDMLNKLAYDQILAEHIIHYDLRSLEAVCKKAKLKIFKAELTPTNGGSIKCFVCRIADQDVYANEEDEKNLKEIRLKEFDLCLDEQETYEHFKLRVFRSKQKLVDFFSVCKREGKKVHILGASTKLNTVLGFCQIGPQDVEYAAERSIEKHGAKTLSGIKIISEEESRAMKPDYYLVGPYHFKKEIIEREQDFLKGGGKLVFCLPEFEVISHNE